MIELDGREVKVGDKMWSFIHGWVEVVEIGDDYFIVILDSSKRGNALPVVYYSYKYTGAYHPNGPRCIFWDEVTITPPKPKQKVKKWRWAFESSDAGHTYTGVTGLMTEPEITDSCAVNRCTVVGRILETEEEVWV